MASIPGTPNGSPTIDAIWHQFWDCHRVVPKCQKTIGFYSKNVKIQGDVPMRKPWGQKTGTCRGNEREATLRLIQFNTK